MTIRIEHARLSLVWTEAFPYLLDGVTPVAADRAFLGRAADYIERFEQSQAVVQQVRYRRRPVAQDLSVPWPMPWGQRFWMHYLGGSPPGRVSGTDAWNALVPFREKVAIPVEARWLAGSAYQEMFLYPHGIGFVLSVAIRPRRPASIESVVNTAFKARRDRAFSVGLDGDTKNLVSERLADELMDRTRRRMLQGAAKPTQHRWEPFTVLTVTSAEGADAAQPPSPDVVSMLSALTSWRRGSGGAPKLNDDNRLPAGSSAGPGDLVFADSRGRAVWFPRLFGRGRNEHALGCFHRNLTLLSLQVESLVGLVRLAEGFLSSEHDIPVRMHECVANALRVLGDLTSGRRANTYRSHSPKHQVDHDDASSIIASVSRAFA